MSIDIHHEPILPPGFRASGLAAGIKPNGRLDLGLIVPDAPCQAAGVFTTNQVVAAPVVLSKTQLSRSARIGGIVVNAGNANACTGEPGMRDAEAMVHEASKQLGVEDPVLVCSTGSIGKPLPMDRVLPGIAAGVSALSRAPAQAFAEAILTTDLVVKYATVVLPNGKRITGIVKGSGMIEPNMATMLAFLLTDECVPADVLQEALESAVNQSFNRISVDGDQSTNDSVILLANGEDESAFDRSVFEETLIALCRDLALQIVRDGEGAKHLITLEVHGAASEAEADRAARAVANSLLVKTAWTGTYPAWGRILSTFGSCGIQLDPAGIDIDYDQIPIVRGGLATDSSPEAVRAVTEKAAYTIRAKLGSGPGSAVIHTCDCSEEYVRINME